MLIEKFIISGCKCCHYKRWICPWMHQRLLDSPNHLGILLSSLYMPKTFFSCHRWGMKKDLYMAGESSLSRYGNAATAWSTNIHAIKWRKLFWKTRTSRTTFTSQVDKSLPRVKYGRFSCSSTRKVQASISWSCHMNGSQFPSNKHVDNSAKGCQLYNKQLKSTYILLVWCLVLIVKIWWCCCSATQGRIKWEGKKTSESIINPSDLSHIIRDEKWWWKTMPLTSNTKYRAYNTKEEHHNNSDVFLSEYLINFALWN